MRVGGTQVRDVRVARVGSRPATGRGLRRLVGVGLLLVATSGVRADAQGTAVDAAVARARALVEAGNGRAGRLVLDSLVERAGVATPPLGELLYWRGLLAESSADAERDWRRLLLEVPMSPRAEDALLRLAQLEQLRGRPAGSRAYLEKLAREYPEPSSQARAHFWLAKAYFDENDRPRACGALDVVRQRVPSNAVELRAQAEDLRARCRGVTAVAPLVGGSGTTAARATEAPAPSPPPRSETRERDSLARVAGVRDSLRRDSLARVSAAREDSARAARERATREPTSPAAVAPPAVPAPAATVTGTPATGTPPSGVTAPASSAERPANARFSVQLAALNTRAQAEQFATRFRARGIEDVRVDGTAAPFRVRTGWFATRAQATTRLAEVKAKGLDGFVAELTP